MKTNDNHIFAPYVRMAYYVKYHYSELKRTLARRKLLDYEIFYLKSGYGVLHLDSSDIKLIPGFLYIIQPKIAHSFSFASAYCKYIHCDLFFNKKRDESYVVAGGNLKLDVNLVQPSIDLILEKPLKIKVKILNIEEVETIFNNSIKFYKNPSKISELFQQEDIVKLIRMFTNDKEGSSTVNSLEYRIKQLYAFLKSNLHKKISIDELSNFSSISKYYLIHLFKKKYKMGPIHCHNKMRMEMASQRLTATNISISELSYELNFESPYTFSRSFKRFHGISPANYRKNLNQQ